MAALARAEWRRRWVGLVAIGVVAGLAGGAVLASVALARRTATASPRLERATRIDDARALVGDRELAEQITRLDGVERSWVAQVVLGRLAGPDLRYVGVAAGPPRPADLFAPILVEGRAADPEAVDEAVVVEGEAGSRLGLGDEAVLSLLTPEEVLQFDTGFGEPDGPAVRLRITGVVRVPGGLRQTPVLATPAFAERYRPWAAFQLAFLRLRGGQAAVPELTAAGDRLAAARPAGDRSEFQTLEVQSAFDTRPSVASTTNVLVAGMAVFALAAAAVGLLAVGQALARHHAVAEPVLATEAALGLTGRERALGRLLPTAASAATAAVVAVAIGLATAGLEPPGALRAVEPSPGLSPNLALLALGGVAVAVTVLALSAALARRATRRRATTVDGSAPASVGLAPAAVATVASPVVTAGLGFAIPPRRGRAALPVRSSLLGAVVGVFGITGAIVFAGNLEGLEDEPARYGWQADLVVVDATDEIVADLEGDARFDELAVVRSATVRLGGDDRTGYAFEPRRGDLGWTVIDGRLPVGPDEVALGPRLAGELDRGPGDQVSAEDADGGNRRLRVVGTALGPVLGSERLGTSALLSPEGLRTLATTDPFTEALVGVVPTGDPDEVARSLGERYEIFLRAPPPEAQNLLDLGRLPEVLAGFLAIVAVAAVGHALAVSARRRRRDLAVMRAVGFTGAQTAGVVVVMALATALVGLAVGLPLGVALGRVTWSAVASANSLVDEAFVALGPLAAVVVGVPVAALLASALPTRRAARLRPGPALRTE